MASDYQDEIAVLQILAAALAEYGCPRGMVSDNGAVFTAAVYKAILAALDIEYCPIEKGKPWENLIEAQFKIQLRLADHKFTQAETLDAIQAEHAQFVETFNTTAHWAHRDREDRLHTPVEVLSWVRGRMIEPAQLQRVLRQVQIERTVNRLGYVSIQRFYLYAESGLARKRVAIWLYEGRLHIEYQHTLLARYHYCYDRKHRRLQTVDQPQHYPTRFVSPQLELWELDDEQWRKVIERPARRWRQRAASTPGAQQLGFQLVGLLIVMATFVRGLVQRRVG